MDIHHCDCVMSNIRKVRPLGHSRASLSYKRIRFPPLNNQEQIDGVQGSAMMVPPSSPEAAIITPSRTKSDSSSLRSQPHENVVERQRQQHDFMIKERHLRQQIATLQRKLEDATDDIAAKNDTINKFHLKIDDILQGEKYWKEQYEAEVDAHGVTKEEVRDEQQKTLKAQQQLTDERDYHETVLRETKAIHEERFSKMEMEKNQVITDRDEKLKRLKMQIAEALKGNSWERQQQLDELTKELSRMQDEAYALRTKLKMLSQNNAARSKDQCVNCEGMAVRMAQLEKSLHDKDRTVTELKTLLQKFEKQLHHSDTLLKLKVENGYKTTR